MVALATFASLGHVGRSGSQESTANLKHRSANHPYKRSMEYCGIRGALKIYIPEYYCTSKLAELVNVTDAVTYAVIFCDSFCDSVILLQF